ncbi:MAG TPA: hypothetical protein VJS64_10595 [Pyrinomonadaceae bacterium]|nr:hypothetical protein [Pyrinomonadaceae bacterium]
MVSRSGIACWVRMGGWTEVEAPQTAQLLSPAPTMAPQLRHIVGRGGVGLSLLSDKFIR